MDDINLTLSRQSSRDRETVRMSDGKTGVFDGQAAGNTKKRKAGRAGEECKTGNMKEG